MEGNVNLDNTTIKFKHTSNASISKMSTISVMTIQAIKTLGSNKMTERPPKKICYHQKKSKNY